MANCQNCLIKEKPYWKPLLPLVNSNTHGLCAKCKKEMTEKEGLDEVKILMDIFGMKK